ncbi:MAG: glycosyltransferase family 9 protein [Elusimicrobiota bacterium]
MLDSVRSLVLLRIGRLGDLVIATPAITALRSRFPEARITLVTGERGQAAAALLPGVDETRVLRPLSAVRLAWELATADADLLVDLNPSFSRSSWILARLAGARVKAGFAKGRGDGAYSLLAAAPAEDEHMLDRYARLAKLLSAPYEPRLRVLVRDEDRHDAKGRLAALRKGRPLVGFFPGNFKKFDNRWPEEKFAELADRVREHADVVFLPGPGEEERVRSSPVAGPYPLGLFAAFLEGLDLLVTNATGAAHLAVAVGTPTLSILGRYTQAVWMPRPQDCERWKVPHFQAVSNEWGSCRDVSVDAVYEEFLKALPALGSRRT